METLRIDEIARRVVEGLPPALRSAGKDLEDNLRVLLRGALARLDLVARDEFDAQTKVLERTRARLEELSARVAQLERAAGLDASAAATGAARGGAAVEAVPAGAASTGPETATPAGPAG